MATLIVAVAARTGVDLAGAGAASGGDAFPNTGQEIVLVKNGDSGDHTVTATCQSAPDGLGVTSRAVTVTAGHTVALGPFPVGQYNDGGGLCQLTYSAVTSVTVKVLKVAPA